ncbi:hypothetical protein TNCV_3289871 [Trichonephila clavipes]|nr:hypothetical protein TNCV_3289871 [Trichonephila clavipes]
MDATRVEQRAYIKIAVLRGRNAMECHSELAEALENNALPYRTVARCEIKWRQIRPKRSMLRRRPLANKAVDDPWGLGP